MSSLSLHRRRSPPCPPRTNEAEPFINVNPHETESRQEPREPRPPPTSDPHLTHSTPPSPQEDPLLDVRTGPSWGSISWSALKMIIQVVKECSDVFPPLKSAASGLSAVIALIERSAANRESVGRNLPKVESLRAMLRKHSDDLDITEVSRRNDLAKKLVKVTEGLEILLPQNRAVGFVMGEEQMGRISDLIEDIKDAITEYQISLQQDIYRKSCQVITTVELGLLSNLPRARDAAYNAGDRQKCLRDTRVGVLQKIELWATDSGEHRIHWLSGLAGTGKTTIAQSFAETAFAQGWLGASFFCSRASVDRRNIKLIFPTIAFQLAQRFPGIRDDILSLLKCDLDIGHSSLSVQLLKLIVEPLKNSQLSTMIVIDALDECEDEGAISTILSLLSLRIEEIPSVKFFITSRPEPQLRSAFLKLPLKPITDVFFLHEVEDEVVNEDIRKYVQYRLVHLAANRSDFDVSKAWPTQVDVSSLARKCKSLFIYASTACNYIADPSLDPHDQLRAVVTTSSTSVAEGRAGIDDLYCHILQRAFPPTSTNVKLFQRIVGSILHVRNPASRLTLAALLGLEASQVKRTLRSLHSVLLVPEEDSEPIRTFHASFFDYLTEKGRCSGHLYINSSALDFELAVCCLQLIARKGKKNICCIPPYTLNKDVTDILTRRKEFIGDGLEYSCKFFADHLLAGSRTDDYTAIVSLLIDFFQNRFLLWIEVLSIIGEYGRAAYSLQAVKLWLRKVGISDGNLMDSAIDGQRFLLDSFECVQQSARHIYHSALPNSPEGSLFRKKHLQDLEGEPCTVNGMRHSWGACTMSISVQDSVLSVAYSPDVTGSTIAVGTHHNGVQLFDVVNGLRLATWKHDGAVLSVSFSSNGKLLVSGSEEGTIKIWEVGTGRLIRTLNKHGPSCKSVRLSPCGTLVASGYVRGGPAVWEISSGDIVGFETSGLGAVTSICWLDSQTIVYGCFGIATVWLWETGKCLKTFSTDFDRALGLGEENSTGWNGGNSGGGDNNPWLSDGKGCVSGPVYGGEEYGRGFGKYGGKGNRMFGGKEDDRSFTPSANTKHKSTQLALSANGSKVALAYVATVQIHDATSFEMLTAICERGTNRNISLSPEGDYVAHATGNVLCVTNLRLNPNRSEFVGHAGYITAMEFSPDGNSVVSASVDQSVKLWNYRSDGESYIRIDSHASSANALCMSADGLLVASGSDDGTLKLWTTSTGSLVRTFHHSGDTVAIAISPDGTRIASGSLLSLMIWDLHTGDMLRVLDAPATTVQFCLDGRLMSASSHVIRLWDVKAGTLLTVLNRGKDSRQVSLSADGTHVVAHDHHSLQRWRIARTRSTPNAAPPKYPLVLVPLPDEGLPAAYHHLTMKPFTLSEGTDWILDENKRHIFWISPPFRGRIVSSHGSKCVVGTEGGRITIFDLANVNNADSD